MIRAPALSTSQTTGKLLAQCGLGGPHDLLDGARPPRARLDRGVVGDDDDGTAVDRPAPGDDAVGRAARGERVGEAAVLDEGVVVEEEGEAVADVELVLLLELGRGGGRRPGRGLEGGLEATADVADPRVGERVDLGHDGSPSALAMTIRWTSEVPSPISRILASR